MRVSILDGTRQLAPAVNGFVLMLALPEDERLTAGLVGRAQQCGSGGRRCGSNQKRASRDLHDRPLLIDQFKFEAQKCSRRPLLHLCASAAFSSTSLGSANCNQKPIISSSLGSPQRMVLDGSGFCELSNELSKYAVVANFVPLGSANWCFRK